MDEYRTIVIADDDIHIGNIIEEALKNEGYHVLRAYSGTEVLLLLSRSQPDLILLDLMMPGLSGEEVLPHLSGVPVMIISAKADIDGKVNMLSGGAVDYITKPFALRELLARVQAHLRTVPRQALAPVYRAGDLRLDTASHEVSAGGKPVKLTKTEYAILKLLMRNANQVIAKSVILDQISADTPDCTENSLKIHISNLRRKLREASGGDYIEAVWGIGFKLSDKK